MQAWFLLLPVQHCNQHNVHPSCEQVHTVSALTACMASKPRMRHLLHALHCTLHGQKRHSWLCCTWLQQWKPEGNRRVVGVQQHC